MRHYNEKNDNDSSTLAKSHALYQVQQWTQIVKIIRQCRIWRQTVAPIHAHEILDRYCELQFRWPSDAFHILCNNEKEEEKSNKHDLSNQSRSWTGDVIVQ